MIAQAHATQFDIVSGSTTESKKMKREKKYFYYSMAHPEYIYATRTVVVVPIAM